MRAHSFHQILLDCNLKANAFYAIHGLEPVKMATISKLPKNKASTPQCGFILGRKRAFRFSRRANPRPLDKHSLFVNWCHSTFGDAKPHAILVFVSSAALCGEA
jgi:hypothetical protein